LSTWRRRFPEARETASASFSFNCKQFTATGRLIQRKSSDGAVSRKPAEQGNAEETRKLTGIGKAVSNLQE
jgi:hypothetical protein